MNGQYTEKVMQQRAIYPSRFVPHVAILVGIKSLRSFGIFMTYDLLKLFHVVHLLFFINAGSSVFLLFLQKPFSSGRRLTKNQSFRVFRHAFVGGVINLLWLFGLTLCGPFRSLLLYEHGDTVVISGMTALFASTATPAKLRGAVFFLLSIVGILFFDHDDVEADAATHEVSRHDSIITHLFDHVTNLTGLSDHKGGVVLLVIALCANVGYNTAAKKLSVDLGGAKRLHTLSTLASSTLLAPWALFITLSQESPVESWLYTIIPILLVIVIFIGDYYIESVCMQRLEPHRAGCYGSIAVFVSGLFLSVFWNHPFVTSMTTMRRLKDIVSEDHVLSGGVIFSFILIIFATHILSSPVKGTKGSLIGYSAAGLPLYNFAGDALQRTSQSVYTIAKNGLRQILEESDSRKIFYFLCINLAFTFVELIWGVWTNSLGLISDGFHMLFDCSALVMGLYAAVMSRWKATRIFSYGFDRVEILSGFVNGLFLMVIACFVFVAALGRIFDPPEIHTEKLLAVSVAGFLVNLVGIVAFRHAHTHSPTGHGHSHSKGHSHKGHSHSQPSGHNTNMEGVFLHVLADTLGSVGVIISTLLIEYLDLRVADPLCSLFIASLIFISVMPLVKETALVLLLRTPEDVQHDIYAALTKVLSVEGVVSYRGEHFWRHSSRTVCGTLFVQVQPQVNEQKIMPQVSSLFKEIGVNNLTVQIEKETYFQHIAGLGVSVDKIFDMTKDVKTLAPEHSTSLVNSL